MPQEEVDRAVPARWGLFRGRETEGGRGEHLHLAVVAGEADGNFQAVTGIAFDHDFAAVGPDDALGDHEAETAAALLRRKIGFEDSGHGFLGHAAAGVGEVDIDPLAVRASADFEESACFMASLEFLTML